MTTQPYQCQGGFALHQQLAELRAELDHHGSGNLCWCGAVTPAPCTSLPAGHRWLGRPEAYGILPVPACTACVRRPRQPDRNIALVGRVVQGIKLLVTLPRGSVPMGFYERPGQYVPITSLRVAADVPAGEREALEVMRTDTASFRVLVESRRNRRDDWYLVPAGYIDLCNVPIVVRPRS
jgi:hypothetical protein